MALIPETYKREICRITYFSPNQYSKRTSMKEHCYFKWILLVLLLITKTVTNAQDFNWVKGIGGQSTEWGYNIAVDGAGNVFTTGWTQSSTLNFNTAGTGDTVNTIGNRDIYLAKYDAAGNYKWGKVIGGKNADEGRGVAVDKSGNVYVTGFFKDTIYFTGSVKDTLISAGKNDILLVKYDAIGNLVWAKSMGGAGDEGAYGMAIDANDNIYITGGFASATVNFNPGGTGGVVSNHPTAFGGSDDIFLVKYTAAGDFVWGKSMGGTDGDAATSIAVDKSGNVFIAGALISFLSDFNRGGTGGTVQLLGEMNSFLAKYDTAGAYKWAKCFGVSGNFEYDIAMSVAADGMGNAYLTGYFAGASAAFNPGGTGGVITSPFAFDNGYLAKYDGAGNYQWVKKIAGDELEYASGVAADAVGNVYVAGHMTSSSVNFNPSGTGGILTNRAQGGLFNIFIAKYNTTGDFRWAKRMGGSNGWDQMPGSGLTVDRLGNVYATGYLTTSNPDFDPGDTLFNSSISYEAFVVKYSCSDSVSTHLSDTGCSSFVFNGQVLTAGGVYAQHFPSSQACDSTVVLTLTLDPVIKPVINVNGFELSTGLTYTTYQWLKNGAAIQSATGPTYNVTENASYRVVTTNARGCTDTSDAYTVNNYVGVGNPGYVNENIMVYPNPTKGIVFIQSPIPVSVTVTDMQGRVISQTNAAKQVSLSNLAEGIYLLRITDDAGNLVKIIKQIKQAN